MQQQFNTKLIQNVKYVPIAAVQMLNAQTFASSVRACIPEQCMYEGVLEPT